MKRATNEIINYLYTLCEVYKENNLQYKNGYLAVDRTQDDLLTLKVILENNMEDISATETASLMSCCFDSKQPIEEMLIFIQSKLHCLNSVYTKCCIVNNTTQDKYISDTINNTINRINKHIVDLI